VTSSDGAVITISLDKTVITLNRVTVSSAGAGISSGGAVITLSLDKTVIT
jgi:hypothetical protein